MFARRLTQRLLLLLLFAGVPYLRLLPERPYVLLYESWFPRWFPEHGGP